MSLIISGAHGGHYSLESLLQKYERLIHYTLARAAITKSAMDYEDLAQELRWRLCELALSAPCHPFEEPAQFTGYMKPRLYHYLIDLRRGKYKHRRDTSFDALLEQGDGGGVITMEDQTFWLVVDQMRQELEGIDLVIFDHLVFDSWTLSEIACALNVSVAAISKRRKNLRNKLRSYATECLP
ncbi:MAG: sigma-70 family RNA polymerase sigma factor [Aerococcus sp.]|nr:sigma-70 family RNA polymerase sigma factor [Aerococcus sp.]